MKTILHVKEFNIEYSFQLEAALLLLLKTVLMVKNSFGLTHLYLEG